MIKNMNIDKAKKYAEGKVADALSQVVADAYLAGYNAGYQDGIGKVAKNSVSEETEFVDLGLPSGTIWSSDYVKTDNGNVVYVTKENFASSCTTICSFINSCFFKCNFISIWTKTNCPLMPMVKTTFGPILF